MKLRRASSTDAGLFSTRSINALFSMALTALLLSTGQGLAQENYWVSKALDGNEGDGWNDLISISADGRYVAFDSDSTNLVVNDTNNVRDIFVHDTVTGETTRVSVDSAGNQADAASNVPSLSGDGRYVAFCSGATNLVDNDDNGLIDVFVHDRDTGKTTRVSVASDGSQAVTRASGCGGAYCWSGLLDISADGRAICFRSHAYDLVVGDQNEYADIFVHDQTTGETTRVSIDSLGNEADDYSSECAISANGRYVAFASRADNLAPIDPESGGNVFVHDRESGQTTLVNVDPMGVPGDGPASGAPSISATGRYVAFQSSASNLVPDDTNGYADIFIHDRDTGENVRVSVDSEGNEVEGVYYRTMAHTMSDDGRYVIFTSSYPFVPNDENSNYSLFLHDSLTGVTSLATVAYDGSPIDDGWSLDSAISADGRYVAFVHTRPYPLIVEGVMDLYAGPEVYMRGALHDVEPQTIEIDVAWQRDPNQLNPDAGKVQVAILTTENFDAHEVIWESALLGPSQASPVMQHMKDFDGDADEDMLLVFETVETGIACGDTETTLTALTVDGQLVTGSDAVVPVGCH